MKRPDWTRENPLRVGWNEVSYVESHDGRQHTVDVRWWGAAPRWIRWLVRPKWHRYTGSCTVWRCTRTGRRCGTCVEHDLLNTVWGPLKMGL